jgi:hypothetical protein
MGLIQQYDPYLVLYDKIANEDGYSVYSTTKSELKHESDFSQELVAETTQEDNSVARILVGPSCFDCLDDILLFSFFRDATVYDDRGYQYGIGKHIEVKVKVR